MNMDPSRTLEYRLVRPGSICPEDLDRMYALMNENYDCVGRDSFEADLRKKQLAGLLVDEGQVIQGFSTFSINPGGCGTLQYNVLFSGDTIISQGFRGTQELVRGWCRTVGGILASEPGKPLYWLLISKGDRTYMYLPLFFRRYTPALEECREPGDLRDIADACARKVFGNFWSPERGTLHFPESRGQMKPELIESTWSRKDNPHVGFFLSKNPGFGQGDELVCMAEISPENMRGMAKRYVEMGLESGLPMDPLRESAGREQGGRVASSQQLEV
jgi:hypothetical protein